MLAKLHDHIEKRGRTIIVGHQSKAFLNQEGNEWYWRNKDKPYVAEEDEVFKFVRALSKGDILEFGSGRGHRLGAIRPLVNSCVGIDPSTDAIKASRAKYPDVQFIRGTAVYQYLQKDFDVVIYGFCLYLCDPADLFRIVQKGDEALRNGGYLMIHDFDGGHPHKVKYHHLDGIFSHKMDWSNLWLSNPAYTLVSKVKPDDDTALWILRKDIKDGWPLETLP
jgi:SAM-dependent methyltransferase